MALTPGTLRELRTELVDLQQQRSAIDARIKGIELILSVGAGNTEGVPQKLRRRHSSAVQMLEVPKGQREREGSLRSKLTDILRGKSRLTSAELTDLLHREGFRVGGTTELRDRVYHELSRLRRLKVVDRRRGKYTLTTAKAKNDRAGSTKPSPTETTG